MGDFQGSRFKVCVCVRVSLHCASKTDKGDIVIMIMEVDITVYVVCSWQSYDKHKW